MHFKIYWRVLAHEPEIPAACKWSRLHLAESNRRNKNDCLFIYCLINIILSVVHWWFFELCRLLVFSTERAAKRQLQYIHWVHFTTVVITVDEWSFFTNNDSSGRGARRAVHSYTVMWKWASCWRCGKPQRGLHLCAYLDAIFTSTASSTIPVYPCQFPSH